LSTILILEADPHQRLLLDEELQSEGYATVAPARGAEALNALAGTRPDLVLLGVASPADGVQVIRRIIERYSVVPIIVCSTYSSECRDIFVACGADACVLRRSDLSELKATVRRVLRGCRSVQPSPPPDFACVV